MNIFSRMFSSYILLYFGLFKVLHDGMKCKKRMICKLFYWKNVPSVRFSDFFCLNLHIYRILKRFFIISDNSNIDVWTIFSVRCEYDKWKTKQHSWNEFSLLWACMFSLNLKYELMIDTTNFYFLKGLWF